MEKCYSSKERITSSLNRNPCMPRGPRLDAPGTLHHVIVRGIEKGLIVRDDEDRADFLSRMGRLSRSCPTSIHAWAIMSNHIHILLKSGPDGLSRFMRKLLTGYAIRYNRRHERCGHLFQNRYKSIVCQESAYFLRLVSYIHLNPFRAGLVSSLEELDRYAWSGHAVLMGHQQNEWQERDFVLSQFGGTEKIAVERYREFLALESGKGRQPDLVGGGLIRSLGGWFEVKSHYRKEEKQPFDERILGDGDFVDSMLAQSRTELETDLKIRRRKEEAERMIRDACQSHDVAWDHLVSGSRRPKVSVLRKDLCLLLVNEYGYSLAETARQLGISTSGVHAILNRS